MFEFFVNSEKNIGIFLAGQNIILENNKYKKIVLDGIYDLNFQIYSCDYPSLIFPISINFDKNRWFSNSKYAELTQISKNQYLCKIKFCEKYLNNKIKKICINDLIFNIFENGHISIEDKNNILFNGNFDFETTNAQVLALDKENYAINLFSNFNQEKTIIINNKFECEKIFDNAIVEKTENGVKVLQEIFDIANHGIVSVYNFENEFKKVDEYSVYMKNHSLNRFAPEVLPIYFLQCVKANDFMEAKKSLDDDLKNKISNKNIKSYFGEFEDIVCFGNEFYLKYKSNRLWNYDTKKCQFSIFGDKIKSINLLDKFE